MDINNHLTNLLARMPELEWQLNKQICSFSSKILPPGLFRQAHDAPAANYVQEIRADIAIMSDFQTNQRVAHYLALKIDQKINVLVAICSRYNRQNGTPASATHMIDRMTTRQQRLQSLESFIQELTAQRNALVLALEQTNRKDEVLLNLAQELGEVEKRLTLAEETYARASGVAI